MTQESQRTLASGKHGNSLARSPSMYSPHPRRVQPLMSRLYAREICAGAAVRDVYVARVPAREHTRWQTHTRFHDLDTDTHRNMVADSHPDALVDIHTPAEVRQVTPRFQSRCTCAHDDVQAHGRGTDRARACTGADTSSDTMPRHATPSRFKPIGVMSP